jgi:hypothetical protein
MKKYPGFKHRMYEVDPWKKFVDELPFKSRYGAMREAR